ncbi:hypothetical protein ABTM19_20525, partial [Acinetobacter baumannii]
ERLSAGGRPRPPAGRQAEYTITRPDAAKPAEVNYTITYENGGLTRSYPGRLEVDGDTLKFCYEPQNGGDRPAECKPTETNVYFEFR